MSWCSGLLYDNDCRAEFSRAFLDGFEPKAGEHEQEERNNLYLCCMEYLHENIENVEEVFKIGLQAVNYSTY